MSLEQYNRKVWATYDSWRLGSPDDEMTDAESEIIDAQDAWKARQARRIARLEAIAWECNRRWNEFPEGSADEEIWSSKCDQVEDMICRADKAKCPIPDFEFPEREMED